MSSEFLVLATNRHEVTKKGSNHGFSRPQDPAARRPAVGRPSRDLRDLRGIHADFHHQDAKRVRNFIATPWG